MAFLHRTALIIAGILVTTAGCTSPKAGRAIEPSGPSIKMPTKVGASLGNPWEKDYPTMGSVQVRDTIYVAAQLSWDDNGVVKGETVDAQVRQAYANIAKLLERHSAKLTDVVEETIYVLDLKAALPGIQAVRHELLGEEALVASTLVEVKKLPDPKAQVGIKVTARVDFAIGGGPRGDGGEQRSAPRGGRSRGSGGGRGMGGGSSGGGYGGPSPY